MQKALINKGELTYQQLFAESLPRRPAKDRRAIGRDRARPTRLQAPNRGFCTPINCRGSTRWARKKQAANAIAKLDQYFAGHGSSQGTAPYQLLSECLEAQDHLDQLLDRLEKLRAADAENVPLAYFLAQQYRQANQFDKAEPIYQKLVENKTRPPVEAYQGLIEIYRQRKDAARLLATLAETVGRGGTLEPLGDSAKALVEDVDVCRAVVEEARKNPRPPATKTPRAIWPRPLLAVELEDLATAEALFDAAIKADPSKASEVLLTWGLELFLANQFGEAVKVFQRALDEKANGDNPAIYFYLAGALEMSSRTDEAIAAARKGADLKKDSPRFASRVAWIEYHAKRYDSARKSYAELITRFDSQYDSPESREVVHEARLVLSNISVQEGKMKESEEWVEQVLDEFPEDAGALNDLGYLWADAGKHLDRALAMIQIAVAAEPKNMAYRDSLGWVLFRLGRFPEALVELKSAAAVDEPDGVILDHLAEAQLATGDQTAAIENWNRAAAAFEKSDATKVAPTREKITRSQQPRRPRSSSRLGRNSREPRIFVSGLAGEQRFPELRESAFHGRPFALGEHRAQESPDR